MWYRITLQPLTPSFVQRLIQTDR